MLKRPRPTHPKVIVTRRLPSAMEARMRELFDVSLNKHDRPMNQADLLEAMRQCDVLVPTVTDHIDASLIAEAGDRLQLMANFGNGVDHIRSEEHTSELQSLMRISYAVFFLNKKKYTKIYHDISA